MDGVGGNPPVEGIISFLRSRRVYQVVETWQGVILTIQTFFKAENNIYYWIFNVITEYQLINQN